MKIRNLLMKTNNVGLSIAGIKTCTTRIKFAGNVGDYVYFRESYKIAGWNQDFTELKLRYRDGDQMRINGILSESFAEMDDEKRGELFEKCTNQCYAQDYPPEDTNISLCLDQKWDAPTYWTSSINSYRWASRCVVKVIKIEERRLADIGILYLIDEGFANSILSNSSKQYAVSYIGENFQYFKNRFSEYWDELNNKPGCRWKDNPMVKVIRYEYQKNMYL